MVLICILIGPQDACIKTKQIKHKNNILKEYCWTLQNNEKQPIFGVSQKH